MAGLVVLAVAGPIYVYKTTGNLTEAKELLTTTVRLAVSVITDLR